MKSEFFQNSASENRNFEIDSTDPINHILFSPTVANIETKVRRFSDERERERDKHALMLQDEKSYRMCFEKKKRKHSAEAARATENRRFVPEIAICDITMRYSKNIEVIYSVKRNFSCLRTPSRDLVKLQ